jgi:glycine/D-amino acid oxidase-like deaminating enzyme
MAKFPTKAKVVIIGQGGIVGASIVHHLIERGWDDIVGIDKSAIPTDIGSTAHASDFCYATSHDKLACYTTLYSIDFYEKMGHYAKVGGLEVARVGDDDRLEELKRKVASGKAFGTRASMISAAEAKAKFPLMEESVIQGALWDPDAGLVHPRSQAVAGILVDQAEGSGKLKTFANTACTGLVIENGRIKGVVTEKGTIEADYVVVAAGLWGRLIAEMAGEDLPVMPVDHPLTYFGPYLEFEGTGKEIGCYAIKAIQPTCETPGIRKLRRAGRLSGAITRKKIRACVTRAIFLRKNKLVSRLHNVIWIWNKFLSRWSGRLS